MIVAVNISRSINNSTLKNAAEGDWKLSINKARNCTHIIAVDKGDIMEFYDVQNVRQISDRVRFNLIKSSQATAQQIKKQTKGINLAGFTVKYI